MNSQAIINNCISAQSANMIRTVFDNSGKKEMNADELIEKFEKLWASSEAQAPVPAPTSKAKSKVKRKAPVVSPLSDEERCTADKKDKTRCNGRRFKNGRDPKLCVLHNNKNIRDSVVFVNKGKTEDTATPSEDNLE